MNQGVIIGLVAFVVWGSASSWWYVCKIQNLCNEPVVKTASQEVAPVAIEPVEESPTPVEEKKAEVPEAIPIELNYSGIYFEKNKRIPSSLSYLVQLSAVLVDTLNSRDPSIVITGHTCDLGTEDYNYQLGLSRAESVGDILRAQGLEHVLSIKSKGEMEPLNNNSSEDERAKNRRVEIAIKSN